MENENPNDVSNIDQNASSTTESNGEQVSNDSRDTVAYDTHRKLLSQRKKDKELLEDMANKLKSYEQKEMEAAGQQQKLIEALRKEAHEAKMEAKKVKQNFAWSNMESQLVSLAKDQGCSLPELLLRGMDDDDFQSIEVDENFKVNQEDAMRFIEKGKAKYSSLFKTQPKGPADMTPSSEGAKPKKRKLSDIPRAERILMLKQQLDAQGQYSSSEIQNLKEKQ